MWSSMATGLGASAKFTKSRAWSKSAAPESALSAPGVTTTGRDCSFPSRADSELEGAFPSYIYIYISDLGTGERERERERVPNVYSRERGLT